MCVGRARGRRGCACRLGGARLAPCPLAPIPACALDANPQSLVVCGERAHARTRPKGTVRRLPWRSLSRPAQFAGPSNRAQACVTHAPSLPPIPCIRRMGKTNFKNDHPAHKAASKQITKKWARDKAKKTENAANGGATTDAWSTPQNLCFCRGLKKLGIYEHFASAREPAGGRGPRQLGDPHRPHAAGAHAATQRGGLAADANSASPTEDGRSLRDVAQVHGKPPKQHDAGDRINATMAELLELYKIDQIIADPKYAKFFQKKKKVMAQPRSIYLGQFLAAVHTGLVCDGEYSWERAMEALSAMSSLHGFA
eukprot:4535629-Prymnesium_polylepis.1